MGLELLTVEFMELKNVTLLYKKKQIEMAKMIEALRAKANEKVMIHHSEDISAESQQSIVSVKTTPSPSRLINHEEEELSLNEGSDHGIVDPKLLTNKVVI